MATAEEARIELARRELARRELARRQAEALPVRPMRAEQTPIPEIAPAAELEAARAEALEQRISEEMAPRGGNIPAGEFSTERERVAARAEREQTQETRQVLQPGREGPQRVAEGGIPLFRPTRIVTQEIPAVTPEGEILTERSIVGEDGRLRPPTAGEETAEAFALQPILGAESARVISERVRAEQAEIDRKVAAGEDVSPFEIAGAALGGILTRPGETAGVVEAELGAALRSTLGWVSALAAEGYFRGLGYEVDKNGIPVDPDDFGFAIAQGRRALGLPEVVYPLQTITAPIRTQVGGLSEEAGQQLERLVKAVPQLAVPLPGVATTSQTRKLTTFDPEGRRTVRQVQVPNPTEDFSGWLEATQRRVSQNVASGRTMGDEFLDTPALRDWYAEVWGDPDAAYFGGSLLELFIPAGPGTAAKGAKGLAKLTKADKATKAAVNAAGRSAIRAAEAIEQGKPAGRLAKQAQAAALAIANPVADVAAAVTPGKLSDGRVVRRVAEQVLDGAALDKADAARAKAAIKATSRTPEAIMRDVAPILGDRAAVFGRALVQNIPDDVVMITTNVGVPRVHANSMRASLGRYRRQVFSGSPKDVTHKLPGELGEQVGRFDSWGDMPANLRRQATIVLEDAHAISQAPKQARLARDLTSLQTWFRTTDKSLTQRLLKSQGLDSPATRRARAVLRLRALPLQAETAAVVQARQAIRGAATTELQRLGERLAVRSRELGNADEAVDGLFAEELAASPSPISPTEAWRKVLGAIYGDEAAGQRLYAVAIQKKLIPSANGEDALLLPTVDTLRGVDVSLYDDGVEGVIGVRGTNPITKHMAPDYQKALLKVAVEEGTKKKLAARGRLTEAIGSAIEAQVTQAAKVPPGLGRMAELLGDGVIDELPVLREADRLRARVYDRNASAAERILAENGEEFAEFIEGIAPRARGGLTTVAKELFELAAGTGRRNFTQNATYGYVLPNVVGFPMALFKQIITPLLTVGLRDSADITSRVIRRRIFGGGLTTNDGVYYTGKQLHDLGEELGLGYTTVSSERVGSIADDILRDTRRAAEGPLEGVVKRELNPLDKSFYTRTAEAIEKSMRQGAFEAELVKGRTPAQAAEYARQAFFDYSEVPEAIRSTLGRFMATAAGNSKLYTELIKAVMTNPAKARLVLKAQLQKARAQDPYNLHGDKALKSLGLVTEGNDVYFGPEVPIFAPADVALGMARQGNLLVQDLKVANQAAEQVGAEVNQVVEGAQTITRSLKDVALPVVLDAWDRFEAVPDAGPVSPEGVAPITDEKMFWAAALYAHSMDASRDLGLWDWFERVFKPETVPPPAGKENKQMPEYWAEAPKGQPHVLWGRDETGLPLYKVLKMSGDGQTAMDLLRAASPKALEQAFVAGTGFVEPVAAQAQPTAVFGGRALPASPAAAVLDATLGRAPEADPETVRRAQLQEVSEVMQGQ